MGMDEFNFMDVRCNACYFEKQFLQFIIRIIFYFLPTSSKVQAIRRSSSETVELNI
jgi:hypothetical protein